MNTVYNLQSQSQQLKFAQEYTLSNISILIERIKRLSRSQLRFLNYHIVMMNYDMLSFKGQKKIAVMYEKCRETYNRSAKVLHELGLVYKIFREYTTCIYVLNPIFREQVVRTTLKSILPGLKFFLISMSPLYAENEVQQTNVTPNKEEFYKESNKRSLTSTCSLSKENKNSDIRSKCKQNLQGERLKHSAMVEKVTEVLKLTESGKQLIACFNDHILEYGLQHYQKLIKPSRPFNDFFNLCREYSKEKRIFVDWDLYFKVRASIGSNPLVEMNAHSPRTISTKSQQGGGREYTSYTKEQLRSMPWSQVSGTPNFALKQEAMREYPPRPELSIPDNIWDIIKVWKRKLDYPDKHTWPLDRSAKIPLFGWIVTQDPLVVQELYTLYPFLAEEVMNYRPDTTKNETKMTKVEQNGVKSMSDIVKEKMINGGLNLFDF